jgi:hypothetical protein
MKLRPHHMLDILAGLGRGTDYAQGDAGNGQKDVVAAVLADPDVVVEWVCSGPDTICLPCASLESDGTCSRVLTDREPPLVFKVYNNALDRRLLAFLGLTAGQSLSVRGFCEHVAAHSAGVGSACAHPRQDPATKLAEIRNGLTRFGVSAPPE